MTAIRPYPLIAGVVLALWGAGTAFAQSPHSSSAAAPPSGFINNFGNWSAFAQKEHGKPLCYVASLPKKSQGDYSQRGDTYVMVTDRPAEKTVGEVSVRAGYIYKDGSNVELRIDSNQPFTLFTDKGFAWTHDAKADHAVVASMRAGETMIIVGTSNRGTVTTDTYSLKGFTAAYDAISKACGVK